MAADCDASARQPLALQAVPAPTTQSRSAPPYPSRFMEGPVSNTKMCRVVHSSAWEWGLCTREKVCVFKNEKRKQHMTHPH